VISAPLQGFDTGYVLRIVGEGDLDPGTGGFPLDLDYDGGPSRPLMAFLGNESLGLVPERLRALRQA